jgi:hypothetical protein
VRWLENPRDEGERLLRAGLDAAAGRNDELALRRVWGRLADLPPPFTRGSRWGYLLAGMAVAGGAAAAVALLWPFLRVQELPPVRAIAPIEAPLAPELPVEPESILLGPTTVTTGLREARTVRLKGGARVYLRAQTTLAVDAGQRPALQRGQVHMEVPHQAPGDTFTVAAGPYVIVVVGTTFDVGVDRGHVEVEVREGIVEVWRDGEMVRLMGGHSWRGPTQAANQGARVPAPPRRRLASVTPRSAPPSVPLPPHPADRFNAARDALATGDTAGALQILRELAAGTGPTAENSSYTIGLVMRDRKRQPRAALEIWSRYRERFPRGLLRVEADVSIIETLLELGDRRLALTEAEAFLRNHPYSERREEITRIADATRRSEEGDRPSARPRR